MAANKSKVPSREILREFGFVMAGAIAGIFGVLASVLFDRPWPVWPWLVASGFVIVGAFFPQGLRRIYILWMQLGMLIGRFTTPLILGIFFYLVVTPVGLVWRTVGGGSIRTGKKAECETYRIKSRQPDNENMRRPF